MDTDVMFSSKTDEWETPQDFFDKLDAEFNFTLDVCATPENTKCDRYFTKEQDGLKQFWGRDTVFCNPPYGREIEKWVRQAFNTHWVNINTIAMLLPARTDTKWFHNYIYHKAEIRFIRGRLKFSGAKYNAPFPCMVVIFRGVRL
jgi:site-specific DNA-methyltransferase (adenine-specific)